MLKKFLYKKIAQMEESFGVTLEYGRYLADRSLSAFYRMWKFSKLDKYRKDLPREVYYVARIVADQGEDCGTCVQIGVNLAKKEGVKKSILAAAVQGRPQDLPPILQDVYHFTQAIVTRSDTETELRAKLIRSLGEKAFIDLCLTIATCRVYPNFTRALGYAQSCSLKPTQI